MVDFEDISWGSFQKQFKAYKKQHPKSLLQSVEQFAKDIETHPHHYQARTVKRAIFYLKVLDRKHKKKEIGGGVASSTPEKSDEPEPEPAPALHQLVQQGLAPQLFNQFAQQDAMNLIHRQLRKDNQPPHTDELEGGRLSATEIKDLVQASYDSNLTDLPEFIIDHQLSGDKVKVFKRKGESNQAVVVHRGTQGWGDVMLDARYVLGHNLENTDRFKHAQEIQQKAQEKYGAENTSTVGHSLGSKIASTFGADSKEIINLNKAVAPQDILKPLSHKETNIRTKYDPVSALLALRGNKNIFTIPSISMNPLAEHSSEAMNRIDPEQSFGVD